MKNSRKLLVSSLIMIISFCLLFAGTTFAWFSDSITSSNNIITAGNLDVELEYSLDAEAWQAVENDKPVLPADDLWEPGNEYIFENLANIYKDYFFERERLVLVASNRG